MDDDKLDEFYRTTMKMLDDKVGKLYRVKHTVHLGDKDGYTTYHEPGSILLFLRFAFTLGSNRCIVRLFNTRTQQLLVSDWHVESFFRWLKHKLEVVEEEVRLNHDIR